MLESVMHLSRRYQRKPTPGEAHSDELELSPRKSRTTVSKGDTTIRRGFEFGGRDFLGVFPIKILSYSARDYHIKILDENSGPEIIITSVPEDGDAPAGVQHRARRGAGAEHLYP